MFYSFKINVKMWKFKKICHLTINHPPPQGHSIMTSMKQVRESMGICPQHNILFKMMNVEQHLDFFIRLKVPPPLPHRHLTKAYWIIQTSLSNEQQFQFLKY